MGPTDQQAELDEIKYRNLLSIGERCHVSPQGMGPCYGAMHEPGCPVCDADSMANEDRMRLLAMIESKQSELAELRAKLATAERQRDQAVELLREGGFDPRHREDDYHLRRDAFFAGIDSPQRSAASATCEPMTGEQLQEQFCVCRGVCSNWDSDSSIDKDAWNELAAHIWPNAQSDRREQLRQQIVRTEHGPNLVVVTLNDRHCVVHGAALWEWYSVETTAGRSVTDYRNKADAIRAAEDWLIDQALKSEGESC